MIGPLARLVVRFRWAVILFWAVAVATGFWTSEVPIEAFRRAYRMAPMLNH